MNTTSIARNFGHTADSATQGNILEIYQPGKFPGTINNSINSGLLVSFFCYYFLPVQPVTAGSNYSGVSFDILISDSEGQPWFELARIDLPVSSSESRRNLLALAWDNTPPILGKDSVLAIRLADTGNGFLTGNSYLRFWGSSLEFTDIVNSDSGNPVDSGQQLSASDVRNLLQSLSGDSRLDASAIKNLPSGGGGVSSAGSTTQVIFNQDDQLTGSESFRINRFSLPQIGEFFPAASVSYTQSSSLSIATSAQLNDGAFTQAIGTNPGLNEFIQADLGTVKTIDGIQLAGGSIIAGSLNIQSVSPNWSYSVSVDGINWTTLGQTGVVSNNGFKLLEFSPVQCRYVRVFSTASNVGVGSYEFRIRGVSGTSLPLVSVAPGGFWCGHTSDSPINPLAGWVTASLGVAAPTIKAGSDVEIGNGEVRISGTKVLGTRQTGWTAGTGTPSTAAFNAATATLAQVASRLLAMEQALRAHGLIN